MYILTYPKQGLGAQAPFVKAPALPRPSGRAVKYKCAKPVESSGKVMVKQSDSSRVDQEFETAAPSQSKVASRTTAKPFSNRTVQHFKPYLNVQSSL